MLSPEILIAIYNQKLLRNKTVIMNVRMIFLKTVIYCKPTASGVHSFYMIQNGQEYFLFSQDYRKGVQEYFSKGVTLNESLNFSRTRNDSALNRTMTKIPSYIRYIEKEYDIVVLEQTKKKCKYSKLKCA